MIRYSILIPAYNVEKYIEKTLKSVYEQIHDLMYFEVLIINDGSTDKTSEVVEQYIVDKPVFKIVNQTNNGLLYTRRRLFSMAKGEYVICLDSDDYWKDCLIEVINDTIDKYEPDLILFGYDKVSDSGKKIGENSGLFFNGTIFETSKDKQTIYDLLMESSQLNHIWSKVIKKDIIDLDCDYAEYKDRKGEDLLQIIPIFRNATKIVYLNNKLLNYRLSNSGRGRNIRVNYLFDVIDNYTILYEETKKLGYLNRKNHQSLLCRVKDVFCAYIVVIEKNSKNFNELKEILCELKSLELINDSINNVKQEGTSIIKDFIWLLFKKNFYRELYFLLNILKLFKKIRG